MAAGAGERRARRARSLPTRGPLSSRRTPWRPVPFTDNREVRRIQAAVNGLSTGRGRTSGDVTHGSLDMSAAIRPAFYRHMAIALSLFVIVGFSQTYYLRFLTDLPPLETLVHWHSIVFSAWLLVFIAQTRLVAAQRVDLHMRLGIAAVVLAVIVIAISFATTAVKATIPRIHPSGLTPPQFTIVGIMSLVLFAGFLGLGIAYRRRSAYHKRFMILAMIGVLTPAASRI